MRTKEVSRSLWVYSLTMAVFALSSSVAASEAAPAADAGLPPDVVAARGGVAVTLADIDAKIRSMPVDLQAGFLDDPGRIGKLIDALLLARQVAAEAEKAGVADDPGFAADLELARTELLAKRQMDRVAERAAEPNFEQLARERYLANPGAYAKPPRVDVRHVLISTDGRDEADARALAQRIYDRATAGEDFQQLISEVIAAEGEQRVSSDLLLQVDGSRLDPEFAASLSGLEKVGDLVGPVRSRFGYHVVRLEFYQQFPVPPFDEIRDEMVNELREQHRANERNRYLAVLANADTKLNDALIRTLPGRHSGKPQAGSTAQAE